jgi:uncharacterized membrane protein YdjX (TVP38/TMEM64 family)
MDLVYYVYVGLTVLGINVVPFFMPPTWAILAFFVTKYDLKLFPAVLIGASCATLGRIILSRISEKYFRRFFSPQTQQNYESIGEYLNKKQHITIPLMVSYAFVPIPSNDVFIAAGLTKVKIKNLAMAFFVGRLISYTFWVQLTRKLSDNIEGVFSSHYSKIGSVAVEIAGILILYFIGKIAWKKILKKLEK